ncbi:MAG: GTPase HflX, partial [Desulfotomaculaceae bacterium]
EKQIEAVDKVLESLGAVGKPSIMVYNKVDLLPEGDVPVADRGHQAVALSALKGWGFAELLGALAYALSASRVRKIFFIPYQKSGVLSILHEKGKVLREEHGEKGLSVEAEIDLIWADRVEQKLKEI